MLNFEQDHLLLDHAAHQSAMSIHSIARQISVLLTTDRDVQLIGGILYKYLLT